MGFTAQQVDEMSLWEFGAAVDGWNRANGADEGSGGALSSKEKDELWDWLQQQPPVPLARMH